MNKVLIIPIILSLLSFGCSTKSESDRRREIIENREKIRQDQADLLTQKIEDFAGFAWKFKGEKENVN